MAVDPKVYDDLEAALRAEGDDGDVRAALRLLRDLRRHMRDRDRKNRTPAGGVEVEKPAVEKPNRSANKGVWIDFVVSRGVDREEAESFTKDELIERYG